MCLADEDATTNGPAHGGGPVKPRTNKPQDRSESHRSQRRLDRLEARLPTITVRPIEIPIPLPCDGVEVPVYCADVGMRLIPSISVGENSINPLLRVLPNGIETRVLLSAACVPIRRSRRHAFPFNPCEPLGGDRVELWFHGESTSAVFSLFAPWQIGLLTFLWRCGVPLSADAQRRVWLAYR